MTTWYVGSGKATENLTQDIYEGYANPDMWVDALSMDKETLIPMGRVHGNPFLDVCDLGLQSTPGRMRQQMDVYEAAFAAEDESLMYKELFERLPPVWRKGEGLHIIDIEDPMLVEKGEAYVHKQFTDYLADGMLAPEAEQALWAPIIRNYLDSMFVRQLGYGNVPAGVVFEPVRQRFGLPYEWHGAAVED